MVSLFENSFDEENKEQTENEDMVVYMTYNYTQSTNEKGEAIVNDTFYLYQELGEGTFWKAYKVKRNYKHEDFVDDNYYVFKRGKLSKKDDELKFVMDSSIEIRTAVRELNILKTINNPNIARLYECIMDSSKDIIVFVMEYCDLGCLMNLNSSENGYCYNPKLFEYLHSKNVLKDNILSGLVGELKIPFEKFPEVLIQTSRMVFIQLARAMAFLHGRLTAHRDLKPDNIMLKVDKDKAEEKQDPGNFVKVVDFNIARTLGNLEEEIESAQGTDFFKPKEMFEMPEFNPFKVDVYNFGAVLFLFLFNDSIQISDEFSFSESVQLKDGLLGTDLALLRDKDNALFELIRDCLNEEPTKRPTMDQVLEKLEK